MKTYEYTCFSRKENFLMSYRDLKIKYFFLNIIFKKMQRLLLMLQSVKFKANFDQANRCR